MNVFALLANAASAWGGRTAIACGGRRQSYSDLCATAAGFGAFLAGRGLRPGDAVVLFLKNGFEFPAVMFGLFRAGLTAVPVNAKLHPREAAYIVGHCAARAVVVDAASAEALTKALGEGIRPLLVTVGGDAESERSFEAALRAAGSGAAAPAERRPDDPAWIFYTSGTTGRPKGAVLSHRNLVAMAVNCLADICGFVPNDRVLHAAPLSHGSGLYMIPALARGAENVIDAGAGFEPNRIMRLLADERISVVAFLAPTMIVRLLEADASLAAPTLRAVIYGGAPIHLEHLRAALARFGPVLVQLYGLGEAPMTISCLPAWGHERADDEALSSAGYIRTGVEVRLLDDEGGPAPPGEAGEIVVRGDVVMRGYLHDPDADAAAFSGGWLRTGDIGRFDGASRLHVLDRRHDTIISGGTNIYPREVEDVLTRHPAVKEAIVFGVPDPEWGESVAAAVVLKRADAGVTAQDLVVHCLDHLASFKKPKLVRFLPELPKNAYGKVLRRELRDAMRGAHADDGRDAPSGATGRHLWAAT